MNFVSLLWVTVQAALTHCKGLKDEQKQQWELQNKERDLFSLKQSVPKGEQDMSCSDNHATEFLVQLHNKKNKVIQIILKTGLCYVHPEI